MAAVFVNRLRIGMPLQTDPTVIYGLGEAFDGNLRKRDLQTDSPYNTYTARRPAAHADRDAGQGLAARGGAAGADPRRCISSRAATAAASSARRWTSTIGRSTATSAAR